MVVVWLKLNITVLLSPTRLSITATLASLTSPTQSTPFHISVPSVDVLNLIVPVLALPGRCAVFPVGITKPLVPTTCTIPVPSGLI